MTKFIPGLSMRIFRIAILALSCAVGSTSALAVQVVSDADFAYRSALDRYVAPISSLIGQNQNGPGPIQSPDLVPVRDAIVDLQFTADGKFKNLAIVERSGYSRYDMALENALRRVIPALAPPPAPPGTKGAFTVTIRFCRYC